jgi:hypothetical protein
VARPVLKDNSLIESPASAVIVPYQMVVLFQLVVDPVSRLKVLPEALGNTCEHPKGAIPLAPVTHHRFTEIKLNTLALLFPLRMTIGTPVTHGILGVKTQILLVFHLVLVSVTVLDILTSVISKPSSTSLLELKSTLPPLNLT